MQSCGVLYIATGASYLEEARRSAQSVKKHSPTLSIGVVTDQSIQPDADFDIVLDVSANTVLEEHQERYLTQDKVPYYRKILPLFQSPFQKTIFLDSDTFVAAPLDELFTLLDHFDLLVTPAHIVHDYRFEREEPPFSQIPAAFGYFNTGLIAFRKSPASDAFLHRWLHNFIQHTARFTVNDQPAFRLTLFEDIASFHVLPARYNIISWTPFIVPAGGGIVMLHGRNPWLQKWIAAFHGGPHPTLVGPLPWRASLIYQTARILNFLRRHLTKRPNR